MTTPNEMSCLVVQIAQTLATLSPHCDVVDGDVVVAAVAAGVVVAVAAVFAVVAAAVVVGVVAAAFVADVAVVAG